MKILNIIQCANLGGMEKASLELMRELQHRGHHLQLLSLHPIGSLDFLLKSNGIAAKGLAYSGKGGWKIFSQLKAFLQRETRDALLMTGHHLVAFLALPAKRGERRVLAIHFHHTGVKPSWQWKLIYALACARFDAITFPSDFIRREAERLWPAIRAKTHTICNPIPLPPAFTGLERNTARQHLQISENTFVVGNAGWLIPRKRWDIFLQVAREVSNEYPDTVFVIAGDGPEKASLEILAHDLGIGSKVRWLGWQENLSPFYRSLDILLFNSDWDALGLTAMEAMSHGIPVVASVLHGGLSEVLRSEIDGLLLQTHDISRLSREILELIHSDERRAQMGNAGRFRIGEIAAPCPIATAYENLLSPGAA